MQDKQALFDELAPCLDRPRRGRDGRLWAFCPCHPDGSKHQGQADRGMAGRSLSLHPRIGLTCFANGPNCSYENIVKALRNGTGRLPAPPPQGRDRLVAIYDYLKPDGSPGGQKGRFEGPDGKRFAWRKPGATEWTGGVKLDDLALYGIEGLTAEPDKTVYFVEGEKCMESCVEHGLLAVTHGGGAGGNIPETVLEPLRDRDVRLWPDNDAVGRAAMTRIAAQLRGIVKTVGWVTPPIALPEKGDAWDYFTKGGTVEALEKSLPPTEPTITYLEDDGVRISIPTAGGPITFTFTEWESGARSLDTLARVEFGHQEAYSERLNLRSGSKRTELRRELDDFYGKEPGWTRILNTAYNLASATYLGLDRSQSFAEAPLMDTELQWALEPLLPLDAPTVLFGDGSAGKSIMAEGIMTALATGQPWCEMKGPKQNGLYVDWEDTLGNWTRRMDRISRGLGLAERPRNIWRWEGQGIPLAQQLDALLRKVKRDAVGFLVLDSAFIACGGDPSKAELVGAFFAALQKLHITILIIAHITKAGETHKPFGLVQWHNQPRRTWYVARQQEEETNTLELGLICRKVNDGPWPKPIPVEIIFDGKTGPINFRRGTQEAMPREAQQSVSLNVRLKAALAHGRRTVPELVEDLGLADTKQEADRVRATLRRGASRQKNPIFILTGSQWGLVSDEQEV